MTDEHIPMQPEIRDPQSPVNMLGGFGQIGTEAPVPGAPAPAPGLSLSDFEDDGGRDIEPEELDAIGYVDPLNVRPRTSSRVLCVVFGVLMLILAAVAWWLGVRTESGQSYDDMVESTFATIIPGWLSAMLGIGTHLMVLIVSVIISVAALAIAAVRKRWWLIGQMVVFAAICGCASLLKYVLPRPFIIKTVIDNAHNSAPSGHTIMGMVCGVMLVCAVPVAWRWVASLVAMPWDLFVGLAVVCGKWHRPTDAVMSMLIVGGVALIVLAFTRTSGMDALGTRRSSAGVQIIASVAVTAGLFACVFAGYVIWQVIPGLTISAAWAKTDAVYSAILLIAGMNAVVHGVVLALRQLTASPLSRIGLVGEPPAPPKTRG